MSSQLYLWYGARGMFKSQIELYVKIISGKVFSVFSDLEKEAEEFAKDYFDQLLRNNNHDSADLADAAQYAVDIGIEYYDNLELMQYNTILMYTAMLYQYWEQQVRKFLFDEISQTYEIDIRDFCFNIKGVKKSF